VFATLVVTAYLVARPKTWGWYFYPPLVAWVACLGVGCEQVARWIGFEKLRLRSAASLGWPTVLGCSLSLAAVATFPWLREDKVTPMVYERLAEWSAEASIVERQPTILASDIGAVGWYANTRILDSAGLVWPEALNTARQIDQIRKFKPDYVILVVRRSRLRPFRLESPDLAAIYRPIRRFNEFNKTGLDKLEPDIAELPEWWEQDYIIYERVAQQ
jgi:hypothetical protein